MVGIASGEPDLTKLSSGVEHIEGETKNLGELFKEAKEKYKIQRQNKVYKKDAYGNIIRESGILGVAKIKNLKYKQKFCFKFTFSDEEGKTHIRHRKTVYELYQIAKELGYDFKIVDSEAALIFLNENCNAKDLAFFRNELCLT